VILKHHLAGQPTERPPVRQAEAQPNLTQYPDVNASLSLFLQGVQAILGDLMVGMYLHGSLATGDFNPQSSDIDFVVVVAQPVCDDLLSALAVFHARLAASGLKWATRLEGAYISKEAIRSYEPEKTNCVWLGADGHLAREPLGNDWVIQSYVIREQGVTVTGPDPKTLIDPILPEDLRRAELATLRWWWSPQLNNPFRLRSREYQAYAVLTMCRALYTLQFGTVVSKSSAARWAQTKLGERWVALIQRSLTWHIRDGVDDSGLALEFIRYTSKCAQHIELSLNEVND
jgi:hypothetical protein